MGDLQIVFSRMPDHVDEGEFNHWYDAHLDEILSIPGFVSAQRFRLEPVVVDEDAGVRYRYLALYELEGDVEQILAAMAELNLGSRDSYADRKAAGDDGGPELPAWWDEVRFASWNCIATSERVCAR
ncbi:hypothetical protein [Gaiella sp.]|jgi:hypothetical protein|uniref:hypothetical protein n=1 Tax=Gaiella sp. TaxID=2663207 RepID=UPI002E2F2AEE|nr:hypothetical protein [Gaiella sp.]HEX5583011.1 hypothetical protein [Gaiella sp.]